MYSQRCLRDQGNTITWIQFQTAASDVRCACTEARGLVHSFVDRIVAVRPSVHAGAGSPLAENPPGGWQIIDDTGFPKKGRRSVDVTWPRCGMLGKQDDRQVAVGVSLASEAARGGAAGPAAGDQAQTTQATR
jgi:hypothetical protein